MAAQASASVFSGSCEIHLLGVSHNSALYGKLAQQLIDEVKPDVVVLEADEVRTARNLPTLAAKLASHAAEPQHCHASFDRERRSQADWVYYFCVCLGAQLPCCARPRAPAVARFDPVGTFALVLNAGTETPCTHTPPTSGFERLVSIVGVSPQHSGGPRSWSS